MKSSKPLLWLPRGFAKAKAQSWASFQLFLLLTKNNTTFELNFEVLKFIFKSLSYLHVDTVNKQLQEVP